MITLQGTRPRMLSVPSYRAWCVSKKGRNTYWFRYATRRGTRITNSCKHSSRKEDTPIAHDGYKMSDRHFDLGVWFTTSHVQEERRVVARLFLCRIVSVTWVSLLDEKSDKTWDAHYKQLQTFVA